MAEYDSVIPAGGSGKLVAKTTTTALQNRRISKTVAVRTDAAGAGDFTLRFTADVEAPILFKPNSRLTIIAVEGEESRKRLLLRRADGAPLEIHSAATGSEALTAVIEPVVTKERQNDFEAAPGDVWLDLVLSAEAPVGYQRGTLRLATNHPVAQQVGVSYAVRVRPVIEARPNGARLWTTPGGGGDSRSAFLSLRRNGGGDFTVEALEVSHPDLFSARLVDWKPGAHTMLRVELAEDLEPEAIAGAVEGWIEIITDVPARSKILVPVLVASSRDAARRPFPTQRSQ